MVRMRSGTIHPPQREDQEGDRGGYPDEYPDNAKEVDDGRKEDGQDEHGQCRKPGQPPDEGFKHDGTPRKAKRLDNVRAPGQGQAHRRCRGAPDKVRNAVAGYVDPAVVQGLATLPDNDWAVIPVTGETVSHPGRDLPIS